MSGFTATTVYEAANLWVGFALAAVAVLCVLYLAVEIKPPVTMKFGLFSAVLCGFGGYYAIIAGIPTIGAQWAGTRGTVVFTVTEAGLDWSARNCHYSVKAVIPALPSYGSVPRP
ncbi:MAG: hypothetical protein JWQ22_1129 [Devosia sp.]|nr:hypothetical protein [Devosia sp.]